MPRIAYRIILSWLLIMGAVICIGAPSIPAEVVTDRSVVKLSAMPSVSDRKIALVIGNSGYASSPLRNPANDARLMAETLRQLGFEDIQVGIDLDHKSFNEAIETFGKMFNNHFTHFLP